MRQRRSGFLRTAESNIGPDAIWVRIAELTIKPFSQRLGAEAVTRETARSWVHRLPNSSGITAATFRSGVFRANATVGALIYSDFERG